MRNKFIEMICMGLILFCSCKKSFLEQTNPNSITIQQFYTSENDVLLAINGCYRALKDNSAMGEESDLYTDQRSDDTGTNDNQSNGGQPFQFGNYSIDPTNVYLENHWSAMYQVVAQCNSILSGITKVTFTDSLKPQYTAEAEFLHTLSKMNTM